LGEVYAIKFNFNVQLSLHKQNKQKISDFFYVSSPKPTSYTHYKT
jgi:hypothetical protein